MPCGGRAGGPPDTNDLTMCVFPPRLQSRLLQLLEGIRPSKVNTVCVQTLYNYRCFSPQPDPQMIEITLKIFRPSVGVVELFRLSSNEFT